MVGNGMTRGVVQSSEMFEPHYKIGFLAKAWDVSEDTIRRWFQGEPGVLKVGDEKNRTGVKKNRRPRIELRIPGSVVVRIYRERTKSK